MISAPALQEIRNAGREAIERLFENSPGEYLRVVASLIPKELILEKTQEETIRWVINASPTTITEQKWRETHALDSPELLKSDT